MAETKGINQKLMLIQHELKAPKDKTNNFGKFKYRSCEDILEAVKPLLFIHHATLVLCDVPVNIEGRFYIRSQARITDVETGESVSCDGYAREVDARQGMDPAQLTGACSSYARKYALCGLLAIDDNKDPDTDEFVKETKEAKNKEETPSFGTASKAGTKAKSEPKPSAEESAELQGLRALMTKDKITEEQVLGIFKGKYSAVENISEKDINGLMQKWEQFVNYTKGGN